MQAPAHPNTDKIGRRETPALQDFRAALAAFSDDPSSRNLVRYLMASRALDQSRPTAAKARRRAPRLGEPQPAT
jgi:hypothetical protein